MESVDFIRQWSRDVSITDDEVLLVHRLRKKLSDDDVAFVLKTIDEICPMCWDRDEGCQCWNDE